MEWKEAKEDVGWRSSYHHLLWSRHKHHQSDTSWQVVTLEQRFMEQQYHFHHCPKVEAFWESIHTIWLQKVLALWASTFQISYFPWNNELKFRGWFTISTSSTLKEFFPCSSKPFFLASSHTGKQGQTRSATIMMSVALDICRLEGYVVAWSSK